MSAPTAEEQAELRRLAEAEHEPWDIDDRRCPGCDDPIHLLDGLEPIGLCNNCRHELSSSMTHVLDALDTADARIAELETALAEATRDTVMPRLNVIAERLIGIGEETLAGKNTRIAALEADLDDAKHRVLAAQHQRIATTRVLAADLARVTGALERERLAFAGVERARDEATRIALDNSDALRRVTGELAELKRAVADNLHYDMRVILSGTPEERAAAAMADRTRERDAAVAELAEAKAEAAACRFAFDNEHAAANAYSAEAERVTDELAEARANHANDLEHLGRVNGLVDKARADLAAATRAQAELVAEARNHDEDLARVTGELADMTAAFRGELKVSDAALRRASDAEDALATSQREREKLQGERDAALADLDRMNRRWDAAKPFVDAVLDVWDEAIGNRPNEYALKMEPPRVLAKFDRRLVRSMLAPVVEKFGELHDTFMEAEIDEQSRAAGGDPEAIGIAAPRWSRSCWPPAERRG